MKRRGFITKSIIGGVGMTAISQLPALARTDEKPGKGKARHYLPLVFVPTCITTRSPAERHAYRLLLRR